MKRAYIPNKMDKELVDKPFLVDVEVNFDLEA